MGGNKEKVGRQREGFDEMDKAVKAVLRDKRVRRSEEELEEIKRLVEEQRRRYEEGLPLVEEPIKALGEGGLGVEPVIEQLPEVTEKSQEDSGIKKPFFVAHVIPFLQKRLGIRRLGKNIVYNVLIALVLFFLIYYNTYTLTL